MKLPPDKGEGQHWQVKPGNLYSKPVKMHLDPKSPQTVRISLDQEIPALENELKDVDSVSVGAAPTTITPSSTTSGSSTFMFIAIC